jgi:hypothetical protein
MDHSEAVRLQAAEKYVLGELPEALRDEYEEHYFDCAECAVDLKAAAAFVDCSRQLFREEAAAAVVAAHTDRGPASGRPTLVQRFRWAFAVPAFAALVLAVIVTYQDTVTIPHLKRDSSGAASTTYGRTIQLPSAGSRTLRLGASGISRGSDKPANDAPFQVRANEAFFVSFDFTPTATLPAYLCQFQDASGRVLSEVAVPGENAFHEYALAVPGGLLAAPGIYRVVLFGADALTGAPLPGNAAQTFTITIAFRQ